MVAAFVALCDLFYLENSNGVRESIVCFTLLVLLSAFVAVLGFIEPVSIALPPGAAWYRHYAISIFSILTMIFVFSGYIKIYFISHY